MEIPEAGILIRIADFILKPFMWFLNVFKFPLQETHKWHVSWIKNVAFLPKNKALRITGIDNSARFSHFSPFGLYHMPIFGGLTKYVVIEAQNPNDHWHIIWGGGDKFQIHNLPIYGNKLKLLEGNGHYTLYGINDKQLVLNLKVLGRGTIGDGKFDGVRLF